MHTLKACVFCFVLIVNTGTSSLAAEPPAEKRAGADWWSLQPIRRPAIPQPKNADWRANPIDAYIKVKLEENNLEPNPEAERRTFIRRVAFDLTGLPPTPEEIAEFLKDSSVNPRAADEKLVDRLLASTAYGERWGRHWLDVVRFAESHGYEMNTLRSNAWLYRDYVIRAFNRDTPFPRFILEQLAGDSLPDADTTSQAATGFLVAGPHDLVGNATPEAKLQMRSDDLFDMTATTSSVFLGLTVGCARCHDHKFDPIAQRDFYRMQAVFAGVEHRDRPLISREGDVERQTTARRIRAEIRAIEKQLDDAEPFAQNDAGAPTRRPVEISRNVERFTPIDAKFVRFTITATNDGSEPCLDEIEIYATDDPSVNRAAGTKATASSLLPGHAIHQIVHLNDGQYGNGRSWISNERGKGWARIELSKPQKIERLVWGRDRDAQFQDRLATAYVIEVSTDGETWNRVAGSSDRAKYGTAWPSFSPDQLKLVAKRTDLRRQALEPEKAPLTYAGVFRKPDATHLLTRGDVLKPADAMAPGAIAGVGKPWSLPTDAADEQRRRGLAEWLADPANPLPARVMVNRVWHYHFGQGIVHTPSDFGFNGDRPSHPELLDYLAAEFQGNGWKLKPLHRLIVLSKTYRQSSLVHPEKAKQDAGNRLLWRFPARRLEAEAIRDSILQTSGALDRAMGGPGYHLWNYSGYVMVFTPKTKLGREEFRRMVYQFKPRLQQDGVFGSFDCPDGTAVTPHRTVSTTPLQALNLLNDEFIHDQVDRYAARVRAEAGNEIASQVRRAFVLALGREPAQAEIEPARRLAGEHGLESLCRALLNSNEFVTLE